MSIYDDLENSVLEVVRLIEEESNISGMFLGTPVGFELPSGLFLDDGISFSVYYDDGTYYGPDTFLSGEGYPIEPPVIGCTDKSAINYDPSATHDCSGVATTLSYKSFILLLEWATILNNNISNEATFLESLAASGLAYEDLIFDSLGDKLMFAGQTANIINIIKDNDLNIPPEEGDPDLSCCVYDQGTIPQDDDPGPSDGGDPTPPRGVSSAKCEDEVVEDIVVETYQTCFPNPNAIVPVWYDQPEGQAFLNEKTCEYSIVVYADPPDCSEEYINSFINPAVQQMLDFYNKESSVTFTNPANDRELESTSLRSLTEGVNSQFYLEGLQFAGTARVKDFYIPPRPLAKTRILVTVSAEEFNRIPEKDPLLVEFTDISKNELGEGPSFVMLSTKDMVRVFDIVARSFRYFELPYVEWGVANGKTIKGLNFVKDADRIEKFYGDLKGLVEESYDSIFELSFVRIDFDDSYKITSVQAIDRLGASESLQKSFSTFLEKPIPSNPTIMAYVSRLPDIRDDLISRTPLDWYEILEKYRVPTIEEVYASDLSSPIGEEFSGLKVLSDAACAEGSDSFEPKKNAGEWLGAEAKSLAQALYNKLSQNPCAIIDSRILESQTRVDTVMEVVDMSLKEYLASDRIINDLPVMLANAAFKESSFNDITNLYQSMLDNLGYCGWLDLIKAVLDCVLNALGYEDSIGIIVGAAVRGMSKEEFAKFLANLPPELIEIIRAAVSESAPQLLPFLSGFVQVEIVDGEGIVVDPVYDRDLAYSYSSEGTYVGTTRALGEKGPWFEAPSGQPSPSAQDYATLQNVVYDLIVDDLLNIDILLEKLEALPGAAIAISVINKVDKFCIATPKFYPPLRDFIRLPGISVDLCAIGEGSVVRVFPGSVEVPKLTLPGIGQTLLRSLSKLALQILKLALILVLRRLLEIIFEEACKNRTPGDPLGLREALRSRCGNEISDDDINRAAADILNSNIGCVEDPAALGRFVDNVSSVITECEFVDLVNGVASQNVYDLIIQIMKVDPITLPLVECIGDQESLTSFFKSIGALVDIESLCIVNPQDLPFGQSVCEDLTLLDLFRDTRAQALRDKGVDEECINDQLCRLRDRTLNDLEELMDLLHGGIDNILPDLIKDPDSGKEGLLPPLPPATEEFANSMFNSLMDGVEAQFAEDIIGRRGFINMCLADSRGRGYIQHLNFQKMFGPKTFNIYGSRGTRTYPPRDEWGPGAEKSSLEDHNSWVTGPIKYTEDASKFIWLPYLFNPLSSNGEQLDEENDEGSDVNNEGTWKGRPPAIGGLPDKVSGYLQEDLESYGVIFSELGSYIFEKQWTDYNTEDRDDLQFIFKYDYRSQIPLGRTPYDYSGYRVSVELLLDKKDGDKKIVYVADDPILPEVSDYIQFNLHRNNSDEPPNHWARFMYSKIERVLDPDDGRHILTSRDTFENTFKSVFRANIFRNASEGFVNMIAKDISKNTIFDYGYNRESVPEVVFFHLEEGGEYEGDLAGALARYGGSEGNPPFYIKEPPSTGFLKVSKAILPEIKLCDEDNPLDRVTFPNYKDLTDLSSQIISKVKDDRRLLACNGNILKVIEPPFDRALPAATKALNESIIFATIRTYIVEFMLKSLPVFTFMKPRYPDNYTNLITEYIVQDMELGLQNTGRGFRFVRNWQEYYWLFLEQVVQSYSTKLKKGIIDRNTAPQSELDALASIKATVERNWSYKRNATDPKKSRQDKKEAWEKVFLIDSVVSDAKVILRRYVGEEFNRMIPILEETLPKLAATVHDVNKPGLYPIDNKDDLILLSEPRPKPYSTLPGVYEVPYVAGAVNREEAGPVDVPPISFIGAVGTHPLDLLSGIPFADRNWPFVLERYIKVNNIGPSSHGLGTIINIYDWEEYVARTGISEIPPDGSWEFGMRLSFVPSGGDVFDTKMRSEEFSTVEDMSDYIIPGVDFSEKAYTETYKYLIPMVGVEVPIIPDAPGQLYTAGLYSDYVQPLLCKLVEEPEYKLIYTHIFPIARYTSFLGVYVANTFVPSIGQLSDGWASTVGQQKKGGGQWLGFSAGMHTWRGKEGLNSSYEKTKKLLRQILEASCNTNYLYNDREDETSQENFVRVNSSANDFDPNLKWWQWSSLRPAPCKDKE